MVSLTPKGMRDFLPQEMINREMVIEKITAVYRLYGFRPIETPALEYASTLKAKSGDEIAGQIFKIEGDEIGLRFDLTVPLARVAANNAIPKPFKRYCISKVWRKEEPQKGRMREFSQADADIIGCRGMRAEAELVLLANEALLALGFPKPIFLLNNRKFLNAVAEKAGIIGEKAIVFRILDKVDKTGMDKAKADIGALIGTEQTEKLFEMLPSGLDNVGNLEQIKKISPEAGEELEQIIKNTSEADVKIDLFLIRGLGYYTGPIFEIKLGEGIGSVGGGGRYDGLLEIYGQADCATGISLGIERLMYLIAERNKSNSGEGAQTYTKIFVSSTKECFSEAVRTAGEFRKAGISAETDLNERNLKKQFDYANSLGIRYVAVIGEREVNEGKITLRDMVSGKEEMIAVSEAIARVKG